MVLVCSQQTPSPRYHANGRVHRWRLRQTALEGAKGQALGGVLVEAAPWGDSSWVAGVYDAEIALNLWMCSAHVHESAGMTGEDSTAARPWTILYMVMRS